MGLPEEVSTQVTEDIRVEVVKESKLDNLDVDLDVNSDLRDVEKAENVRVLLDSWQLSEVKVLTDWSNVG